MTKEKDHIESKVKYSVFAEDYAMLHITVTLCSDKKELLDVSDIHSDNDFRRFCNACKIIEDKFNFTYKEVTNSYRDNEYKLFQNENEIQKNSI